MIYNLTEEQIVGRELSPETVAPTRLSRQTSMRIADVLAPPVKREIPATLALVGCVAVLLAAWAVLA